MQTGLPRMRTMRRLRARRSRTALPLRGCWQLGMNEMQQLGLALHQLPAVMTGPFLQCIGTTALVGTLVPARGRRQQVGLQLRLASLASFSYCGMSCISLLRRASTAAVCGAASTLLTACCPAAGEGPAAKKRERDCVFEDGSDAWSPV